MVSDGLAFCRRLQWHGCPDFGWSAAVSVWHVEVFRIFHRACFLACSNAMPKLQLDAKLWSETPPWPGVQWSVHRACVSTEAATCSYWVALGTFRTFGRDGVWGFAHLRCVWGPRGIGDLVATAAGRWGLAGCLLQTLQQESLLLCI